MVRLFRAIYENGVFRPLDIVRNLPDRLAVNLRVEAESSDGGCLSDFAGRWSRDDAEEIEALIDSEFEKVDPREW